MKRLFAIAAVLLLLLTIGCEKTEPASDPPVQVVNPVRSVDGPDFFPNDLRFYMITPQDSEDYHYSIILAEISQIQFTYEDIEYNLRGTYRKDDCSGVYGPFEETESAILLDHIGGSCDIRIRYTTDGGAVATWSLFSMQFSLSSTNAADCDIFEHVATLIASSQLDLCYERELLHEQDIRKQFVDIACDSPITITSCDETHIPYAIGVYDMFWDGKNTIYADGGFQLDDLAQTDLLPTISHGEDFMVTFTNNGELDIIYLYDENFQRLDEQWDLSCFSNLNSGTYYAEIVVCEYDEYIPEADTTEYSGYSCVFELIVE